MAGFDYSLFDGGLFGALEAEGCLFDELIFDNDVFDVCEDDETPVVFPVAPGFYHPVLPVPRKRKYRARRLLLLGC